MMFKKKQKMAHYIGFIAILKEGIDKIYWYGILVLSG